MPLLEDDPSPVVRVRGGAADRAHRILLVHENEASDDRVHARVEAYALERFGLKAYLGEAFLDRAALRARNGLRVFVSGDDAAVRADSFCDQQGDVREPRPEHQNAHPRSNPGGVEQFFGKGLGVGGLYGVSSNLHESILAAAGCENHEDTHILQVGNTGK